MNSMKATAMKTIALLVCVIGAPVGAVADPVPTFKGSVDLEEVVQVAKDFSDDKRAVTVLFRNLEVATRLGTTVTTRTVSVSIPIEAKDGEVQLTQDVRGYVDVEENAKAVLVIQAAGQTIVVDLTKADSKSPDVGESVQQSRARAIAARKRSGDDDPRSFGADFFHRINGVLSPGASYQVTFFLLVERLSPRSQSGAHLVVDSLDVEIR